VNDTPSIDQPDESERETRAEPTETGPPPTRRLRRSSKNRVLAGVAGGLGNYFGIDPVIFRIGFALSVFFGGIGLLGYLLLAVFVPTDGEPDTAQRLGRRLHGVGFWRGLGLAAIGLLLLAGLFALAGGAAFAVAVGWGVPIAILIISVGALLALAAFRGGARWLIPPAVALAIGAGGAAAADLDFSGGIGKRVYHPLSAQSIPADGYRLGVGRLVVDLRDLDWSSDQIIELDVDLGAGQASVFVPERVCVAGSSHVGAGEVEVAGERNDGLDADHTAGAGSSALPRLELDANVDVGRLVVVNSDTASVDSYRHGWRNSEGDAEPLRKAEASACATR
jgi:phage shock protein PspC (stress-responsive transcriptional regulator)